MKDEAEHYEAIRKLHLELQASLVKCDQCGRYFQDIEKHVRESVSVNGVEP